MRQLRYLALTPQLTDSHHWTAKNDLPQMLGPQNHDDPESGKYRP